MAPARVARTSVAGAALARTRVARTCLACLCATRRLCTALSLPRRAPPWRTSGRTRWCSKTSVAKHGRLALSQQCLGMHPRGWRSRPDPKPCGSPIGQSPGGQRWFEDVAYRKSICSDIANGLSAKRAALPGTSCSRLNGDAIVAKTDYRGTQLLRGTSSALDRT
jgi:hypothetical protein